MPYTFGAATTDDITWTAGSSGFGNGVHTFACGWFYPTTLTAGRTYFSYGNVASLTIAPTTSEFRVITDGTVDGVWDTTGAGIVVSKWQFIALLATMTATGMAAAFRVWVGDGITRPVAFTPAVVTAPTVAFTGSTSRTVGNKGTGSLAFQGDIGWAVLAAQANATALRNPIHQTSGSISADEELLCYNSLVYPLWRGEWPFELFLGSLNCPTFNVSHVPLYQPGNTCDQVSSNTTVPPLAVTTNGATQTLNEPPIRLPRGSLYYPRLVRRAA